MLFKFECEGCRIECYDFETFGKMLAVLATRLRQLGLAPAEAGWPGAEPAQELKRWRCYRENYVGILQKIGQIKTVRNITGCTLAEGKNWVEGLHTLTLTEPQIFELQSNGFTVRKYPLLEGT